MPDLERYPTLVTFEELPKELRWDACLESLESEYTLPFRRACKLLMCSRSWVSRYIKPNCHYIYLENYYGHGGDYYSIARKKLGLEEPDKVWFNMNEFKALIMSNITSCTRQTVSIPIEFLIKPDCMEQFRTEYAEGKYDKKSGASKMEAAVEKYTTDIGKQLWKNHASRYSRGKSPAVPVPVPEFNLEHMMAVHDLKDYGDTDEMVYRDLFRKCTIRLEVSIPDQDGCISKKIYYINSQDGINLDHSVQDILINYSDYISYKDRFTKWE